MKAIALALTGLILLAGFADPASAEEKILNVYNWSDYIGPDTIADFRRNMRALTASLPVGSVSVLDILEIRALVAHTWRPNGPQRPLSGQGRSGESSGGSETWRVGNRRHADRPRYQGPEARRKALQAPRCRARGSG